VPSLSLSPRQAARARSALYITPLSPSVPPSAISSHSPTHCLSTSIPFHLLTEYPDSRFLHPPPPEAKSKQTLFVASNMRTTSIVLCVSLGLAAVMSVGAAPVPVQGGQALARRQLTAPAAPAAAPASAASDTNTEGPNHNDLENEPEGPNHNDLEGPNHNDAEGPNHDDAEFEGPNHNDADLEVEGPNHNPEKTKVRALIIVK
jgi:hypothetical protein